MSIEQMTKVWQYEFDHAEQAVMLALADHAHDDGTEIRPGIARLAWKTGYSDRQVQRILKTLRDDKQILKLVRRGDGRGHPNVYRFDWSKGVKKSPFTPPRKGDKKDLKGDISDKKGDTVTSPEPSFPNRQSESSVSPTGHSPEEKPAKVMTAKTIERTTEVGFDAAPHQKANWGNGWAAYIYVPEGEEPPSPERQYAVLQEIIGAAAGKGDKARYFLAVADAVKRVEGKKTDNTSLYGSTAEQKAEDRRRRREGYEWLFDDEPVAPFDKEEALRRMRGESRDESGAA